MEKVIQNILAKADKHDIFTNPFMPDVRVVDFKADILSRRLAEIKKELRSFSDFEGYGTLDEMKTLYSNLITKCQKIEEVHRNELESIIEEFVVEMFGMPIDIAGVTAKITAVVKPERVPPVDKSVDGFGEYEDVKQANSLTDAIQKRVIADAIIEGGAIELSKITEGLIERVYKISPELPLLHKKILAVHDFIVFCDLAEQDEKNLRLDGFVAVEMGQDKRTEIKAEGTVFPFALREAIKGVLQLVCSASLPEEVEEAVFVSGQADYINAEPYYARFGVILWKSLFGGITIDTEVLPYYLNDLFEKSSDELKEILPDIFMRTRRGMTLRKDMYSECAKRVDYLKFIDEIREKNSQAEAQVLSPDKINDVEF